MGDLSKDAPLELSAFFVAESYAGKEVKKMRRVCLVVFVLGMGTFVAGNALAVDFFDDLITCVCLDKGDLAARNIEREYCNEDAEALGYQHGVLRPFADRPYDTSLMCQLCGVSCACDALSDDWLYLCLGVGQPRSKP